MDEPPQQSKSPKYYSVLLRGLVVLYGLPALALILHAFLDLGPSMGLTLLACLPAAMLMKDYHGSGFALSLCGLFVAGLSCFSLNEIQRLSHGVKLENVSVAEAARNPEAVVFHFKGAKVQSALACEYKYRAGGKNESRNTYYVAPLTNSDWTSKDPVRAWVVCKNYDATKMWKRDYQAGVRWDTGSGESHLFRAINKAEKKYKITGSPAPLLLKWENPEETYEQNLSRLKTAFALPSLLWFLGLSIHWIKKRAGSPAKPDSAP